MGGTFVNDFNRFGRLYRVYVQAELKESIEVGRHRQDLRSLEDYESDDSAFDAGLRSKKLPEPNSLHDSICCGRLSFRARRRGAIPQGRRLAALEEVFAETMPKEMSFAYSSLSYQEKIAPPAGPTFGTGDLLCVPVTGRDV